jgi:hypothetical protein
LANQTYRIKITSPLLRPGLSISTETSERYAPDAAHRLVEIARKINNPGDQE